MCSRVDLEETYTVLDELCKIVSNPNPKDLEVMEKVKLHKSDIKSVIQKKKDEVHSALAEYQRREQELQDKASNPPARRFQMQQDIVRGEIQDIELAIDEFKQEIEEQERLVAELTDQLKNTDLSTVVTKDPLTAALSGVNEQLAVAESHLRLYSSLLPIVFDEDIADGEMKGTLHLTAMGEVRPFDYNTRQRDAATIADDMWDAMWEEQEAAAALRQG